MSYVNSSEQLTEPSELIAQVTAYARYTLDQAGVQLVNEDDLGVRKLNHANYSVWVHQDNLYLKESVDSTGDSPVRQYELREIADRSVHYTIYRWSEGSDSIRLFDRLLGTNTEDERELKDLPTAIDHIQNAIQLIAERNGIATGTKVQEEITPLEGPRGLGQKILNLLFRRR